MAVTGATGYLGCRLVARLSPRAEVVAVGRAEGVDLRRGAGAADAAARLLERIRPVAVIHTAAANPGRPAEEFVPVNRDGAAAVAAAAAAVGARLVHVSTDVVFDGRGAPYADDAPVCPLGAYGRSKADGEAEVLTRCPEAGVVRTSLIYGLHEPDRSTAGFLTRLARGEALELFADVVRQPVWVEALADSLVTLALDRPDVAGTLNVAGAEPLTRAAFGRVLLGFWGVDAAAPVIDVEAAGRFEDVALDLRLRLDRATELGLPCPGVAEVLAGARPGGS